MEVSQIPQLFPYAQCASGILPQLIESSQFKIGTCISLNASGSSNFVMVVADSLLAFGFQEKGEIGYMSFMQFSEELKFQKIYDTHSARRVDIIGLRFVYLEKSIDFYFKKRNGVSICIKHLEKNLNQGGFHETFKPIRKIGKGAFATVYHVRRLGDNKDFAVKAFSKSHINSSAESRLTIQTEIGILRRLDHQNILSLYEVYESSNSLYLVMEMYESTNFMDLIRKRNAMFSEEQISSLMRGLLKGLSELSNHQIMHRDIKPENILLQKRNIFQEHSLVLGDFGLASYTELPSYLHERCGTPGYVSPEIANYQKGDRLSPKCDVFSVGAIFHILLFRSPLFPGSSFEEVYKKNKEMQVDFGQQMYQHANPQAMDLLKKMLVRDPGSRISAEDALDHKFLDVTKQSVSTPLTATGIDSVQEPKVVEKLTF